MSFSSSAVDYSIGGRIDEVLSKRTTFSTLMRPDKEADENFLSTLYDVDAVMIAHSKESMPSEGGYLRSKTDHANISLSNEDTIRRGYVDVMARWALTKDRSVDESLDTPSRASTRSAPQLNFNESPAERMAARLRLAQEHFAEPLKMVASEGNDGAPTLAQKMQVRNRGHVLGQEGHVLSPVQKTNVGNREPVLEQEDHLSHGSGRFAASPDRRLNVTTSLYLSPAERMAGRLRRAHEQGSGALVFVASDAEDKFESSNHLSALEEQESEVEDYDVPAADLAPVIVPLLSPAERMASRLLEARRLGNNGLVLVSSREEKDFVPTPEPLVEVGVDSWNNINTSTSTQQFGMDERLFESALSSGSKHGDSVDSPFAEHAPSARWDPNHPTEKSPIAYELAVIRSLQLATTELNKLNGTMHVQAHGELEAMSHERGANLTSWNGVTPLSVNTDEGGHDLDDSPATGRGDNLKEGRSGIQGLAASSKTGLQSALQEINRSFSEEKLWWSSKPLSPIRKAIEGAHRISEPTIRSDVDHEAAASKALSAADEELRKFLHPEAVTTEVSVLDETNGDGSIKPSADSMKSRENPFSLFSNETNTEMAALSEVNEIDERNGNVNRTDTLKCSENPVLSDVLGGEKSIVAFNKMSSNNSEKSSESSIPSSADESSVNEDRLQGEDQDTRSAVTPPGDQDCFLAEVFSPVAEEVRLCLGIRADERLRTLPDVKKLDEPKVVVNKSSNTDTTKATDKSIPPSSDQSTLQMSTELRKTADPTGARSSSPTPNDIHKTEQSALVTAHASSALCCFAGPANTEEIGSPQNTKDESPSSLTETPPTSTHSDQSSTTMHDVATDNLLSSQNNTQAAPISASGQEIAERSPTPPNVSAGWFCFKTSLDSRGTNNVEGAGETGARGLSSPPVDTTPSTDHRPVVPSEDISETSAPKDPVEDNSETSAPKEESRTEPTIENGESNREAAVLESTSKMLHRIFVVPMEDMSKAVFASVLKTEATTESAIENEGSKPRDATAASTIQRLETGSMGASIDDRDQNDVVPEGGLSEEVLTLALKEEATTEQAIGIGESNPEDVTTTLTRKLLETISSGDPIDNHTQDAEAHESGACAANSESTPVQINGNVHEPGAQEIAERSPTPSNVFTGCFHLAIALDLCGTVDKEGAAETGARGLSSPSVDTTPSTDHSTDISETSAPKAESTTEPTIENGESNPEAAVLESTSIFVVPMEDMSKAFFTSVLKTEVTTESAIENEESNPRDATAASTIQRLETGSMGAQLDDKGQDAVTGISDACAVGTECRKPSGSVHDGDAQEEAEISPTLLNVTTSWLCFATSLVPHGATDKEKAAESEASGLSPPSEGETDSRNAAPTESISDAVLVSELREETTTEPAHGNDESSLEPVTTASTKSMLETVVTREVIDDQGHDGEVDRSDACSANFESIRVQSFGNVHEPGAQEMAERSPTPPNMLTSCFCLTNPLAPYDTRVKEGAAETGATELSPPLVDADDHGLVEDIPEALVASVLKEETMMEPLTENGESKPEDVTTASTPDACEAEATLEQDRIRAWEAELLAFRTREADQVSCDEAVEMVLTRLKRRIEMQKQDDNKSLTSSGEFCQVDSTKPLELLGCVVSEARSLGEGVFSPEDGELVEDELEGEPVIALDRSNLRQDDTTQSSTGDEVIDKPAVVDNQAIHPDETTAATKCDEVVGTRTVIDNQAPLDLAESEEASSVVAEAAQTLALDASLTPHTSGVNLRVSVWEVELIASRTHEAESTRPFSMEVTSESDLLVADTEAAFESLNVSATNDRDVCANPTHFSGSCDGVVVAELIEDEVEVSEKKSFNEIVFPPEELEEVLHGMLQRVNGEQERLEALDVTQERRIDELAFPSDEDPGQADELTFPSDEEPEQDLQRELGEANDNKTRKECDESEKTFVETKEESDFVTGPAQHERVAEVQESQERIVFAPEELEEVIQRIQQRVNA